MQQTSEPHFVRSNYSWISHALESLILGTEFGETLTGEDIRERLTRYGLEKPDHPNAWGALIRTAINAGHLFPTGQWKSMTRGQGSRKTPVYLRVHSTKRAA